MRLADEPSGAEGDRVTDCHSAAMGLRAIGMVRSDLKRRPDARDDSLRQRPAVLEILPAYREGLDGLEAGDRALVLFWLDRTREEEREVLRVHPRGDQERPMKGVFATRSPARPNPIGATVVRIARVEGGTLVVEGLDALDGSPILDIKIEGK